MMNSEEKNAKTPLLSTDDDVVEREALRLRSQLERLDWLEKQPSSSLSIYELDERDLLREELR